MEAGSTCYSKENEMKIMHNINHKLFTENSCLLKQNIVHKEGHLILSKLNTEIWEGLNYNLFREEICLLK